MSDPAEIRNWILNWIQRELGVSSNEVKTDENLLNYGIDSVNAIMLVGDLESQFRIKLAPTLVWDHPTVDALVKVASTEIAESSTPVASDGETPKPAKQISAQEAEKLLENIDQLSEQEVSQLLERLTEE